MDDFEDFLDEFDETAAMASRARHQDFSSALKRWFEAMTNAPEPTLSRIRWLGTLLPLSVVEREVLTQSGSMVGSGRMKWPDELESRLSGQLNLFTSFANGEEEGWRFAHNFFPSRSNNINDILHEMTEHLFDPMISELRRYLRRHKDTAISEAMARGTIPASDRLVRLDDNYGRVTEISDEIQALADDVVGSNELVLPLEDRKRIASELGAGRELMQSNVVRLGALGSVLVHALKWLAITVAGTVIALAAEKLLQELVQAIPALANFL